MATSTIVLIVVVAVAAILLIEGTCGVAQAIEGTRKGPPSPDLLRDAALTSCGRRQ